MSDTTKTRKLKEHPLAHIVPDMRPEEYAALKADITTRGILTPLDITTDGTILDGRHRWRVAVELGLAECPTRLAPLNGDRPEEYMIRAAVLRRHLTDDQRSVIALRWQREQSARALSDAGKRGGRGNIKPSDNVSEGFTPRDTRAEAAELFAVPERKLRYVSTIEKSAPELLAGVESGEKTAVETIQEIRRAKVAEHLRAVAELEPEQFSGAYDVIVIDPPWPIEKIERDTRQNQVGLEYPTMTLEQIAAIEIPAADNCHVWVWTTQKFLPDAFDIIRQWGLNYVCTFIWHKPGGFQPFGLPQYNAEFAIYARKGSPMFLDLKDFKLCFDAPRGAHSEKPELFYETVRRVTGGRRLDMFNRRKIEGFDGWGKESK